jgi:ELWxxDGT repeat protein
MDRRIDRYRIFAFYKTSHPATHIAGGSSYSKNTFLMNKDLLPLNHAQPGWLCSWHSHVILLLICFTINISKAQVTLIKDINWINENTPDQFRYLQVHNGSLYVMFDNEIWKSGGSMESTALVKRFDYQISELTSAGSYLYFTATDDEHGQELWRTDGTETGTVLVRDIFAGISGSNPRFLRNMNGTLYFTASNGINGNELWKSNGTPSGTTIVKDILRVSGSSNPQNLVVMNNKLYFKANDGALGYELWVSDGTADGTRVVKDINPAAKVGANPEMIVNANGTLFFFASDGVNGKQLWKSSGEIGNASLVKIIKGGGTPSLGLLTKVNSQVFFQANDGIHGAELWRSDGTDAGTYLVRDITPGPGSETLYATPHLSYFKESNGRLYFLAVNTYQDLWSSDGTIAGTFKITDENNVGFAWTGHEATPYQGKTYFAGLPASGETLQLMRTDGTAGNMEVIHENISTYPYSNNLMGTIYNGFLFFIGQNALWRTDGTHAGTYIVKPFGYAVSSMPSYMTDLNGTLYFESTDNMYYHTLWKSNGTSETTVEVADELWQANNITNINGTLYFGGSHYLREELWKSDGTTAGTMLVKNIASDEWEPSSSYPHYFTAFNNKVFFNASDEWSHTYLYQTDGTLEGTSAFEPTDYTNAYGDPYQLTVVGNKLFFTAATGYGNELLVTDGLSLPKVVKDIKINYEGSYPIHLTPFKGILYFQADNRGNGYELYRSDGTAAGTYIVKDIRQYDLGTKDVTAPIDMGNMVATSEALYFTAIRGNGKNALWKSNGIASGTLPLKEFAGMPTSHILAAEGNTIIYALSYEDHLELWTSNGTLAGTVMVKSTAEIKDLVHPLVLEERNGVYYFIGHTGLAPKVYRTDLTAAGSYGINFSGVPYDLEVSGGKLYLSGSTEDYGWELYLVNDNNPAVARQSAPGVSEEASAEESNKMLVTNYPNPFHTSFALKIKGEENEKFSLKVTNMNGVYVESMLLDSNKEHMIGHEWPAGFYILNVNTGENVITKKIVKRN